MAIETHNFSSGKYGRLRLVRQPGVPAFNALGKQQGWLQKSIVYEFSDDAGFGRLTLRDGQDVFQDGPLDDDGQPTWQDAVAWIRQHSEYNQPGRVGGFVEDGREPGRVPDATDVLDDIAEAGASLDPDRLEEILTEERATWKREQVVTLAERQLSRVRKAIEAQGKADGQGTAKNAGNKAPAKAGAQA